MYAVRVVPLASLPPNVPQVLDYFWTAPLPRGAIVGITIGRRGVYAIVLESTELARGKLAYKKSSFLLKRLDGVLSATPQATERQLALAQWIARQYAAAPSACMKTVLPPFVGKRGKALEIPEEPPIQRHSGHTSFVLAQPDTALARMDRLAAETDGQCLILVPEISLARTLCSRLSARRPLLFHGGLNVRSNFGAHRAVVNGSARLVIGTRSALFLPFRDLRHVVIEDPQHEAYKSDSAPRYAAVDVARQLAALHGADVTVLTPALAATHAFIARRGGIPVVNEKPHWPAVTVASMPREREQGNRSLFSRAATEALLEAHDRREPVLLYSGRRAYATAVACAVCHQPILCATCDIPMRLHRTTEDFLVCYRCAGYIVVPSRCPSCTTGTFRPAGLAGSQRIAEAFAMMLDRHGLAKIIPPVLDSDLVKDDAHEARVLARLDAMPWQVLVATSMVLSQRYDRSFGLVVIPQSDALTVSPDFRTQERLIWQLEKLADFRPRTLVIQTWHTGGIVEHAPARRWDTILDTELAQRKSLGWPPFSRLVKISCIHADAARARTLARTVADRISRAASHLKYSRRVTVFGPTPALTGHTGGRWAEQVVLKTTLPPGPLGRLLAHVPAGAVVDVDPRSIT